MYAFSVHPYAPNCIRATQAYAPPLLAFCLAGDMQAICASCHSVNYSHALDFKENTAKPATLLPGTRQELIFPHNLKLPSQLQHAAAMKSLWILLAITSFTDLLPIFTPLPPVAKADGGDCGWGCYGGDGLKPPMTKDPGSVVKELRGVLKRGRKFLKSVNRITGLDLASKESEYNRLFDDIRGAESRAQYLRGNKKSIEKSKARRVFPSLASLRKKLRRVKSRLKAKFCRPSARVALAAC